MVAKLVALAAAAATIGIGDGIGDDGDHALLRSEMVQAHNDARAQHGLDPLAWSQALARDAAVYAQELAASGRFEHSRHDTRSRQGENLWRGTRNAYRYDEMAEGWTEEERHFVRGAAIPHVSRTGNVGDVGHYTQIIWRGTQQVGCAVAASRHHDYLVCRYWPAGNILGRDPLG